MLRRTVGLGATISAVALALTGLNTATAAPAENTTDTAALTTQQRQQLDAKAEAALARTPGGERTAVNQVTWKDKGAVLTFDTPGTDSARGAGRTCSKGEVCLYDGHDFNGDQLHFIKCKFQKLRWYGFTNRTSSWKAYQTGGAVAKLYYWTDNEVVWMDELEHYGDWAKLGGDANTADFVKVC